MSIEALKEKARGHEQKEEWQQALDLYLKAISKQSEDEQPDIGLYNRAGDLQTRIGNVEAAVEQYEMAVDHYLEADLPNNAVAICKKVIRNLPGRASIYLKLGQIRANQGFLAEARQNFLTYAELQQQAGNMDEAFRALSEFADLAPDDVDIRMAVAGQLEASERVEEAVEEYIKAYQQCLRLGETDQAEMVKSKIDELAPGTDIPEAVEEEVAAMDSGLGDLPGFDTTFSDDEEEDEDEDEEIGGLEDFDIAGADEEEAGADELAATESLVDADDLGGDDFGGFEIGDEDEKDETDEADEVEEAEELPMMEFGDDDEGVEDEEEAEDLPMMEIDAGDDEADEEEAQEEFEDLPMMEFGDDDEVAEGEEEAEELPMMEFGDDEADEEEGEEEEELTAEAFGEADHRDPGDQEYVEEAEELPEMEVELDDFSAEEEEADAPASEAVEAAMEDQAAEAPSSEDGEALFQEGMDHLEAGRQEEGVAALERARDAFAEAGDLESAMQVVRDLAQAEPDEVSHHQRLVELAHRSGDPSDLVPAYLSLAGHLERTGAKVKARAVYQQVLSVDPDNEEAKAKVAGPAGAPGGRPGVASSDSYVDLGSMVMDEDEGEKTTRWVVAAEEPTGDEQADFANMLAQFKQKVSENVAEDDLTAHYDLGTAYKEMGLVDEAISEFQAALRADSEHLATYEMLGQCFMEQGEFDVAVKTLQKAVDVPHAIEDDLIGIFYYLGRAHEEAGNTDQAREFYEKVFALDINFADVTERLRALR